MRNSLKAIRTNSKTLLNTEDDSIRISATNTEKKSPAELLTAQTQKSTMERDTKVLG